MIHHEVSFGIVSSTIPQQCPCRHSVQQLRTEEKGGNGMVTKIAGLGNHTSTERSTVGERRVNRVTATYIYIYKIQAILKSLSRMGSISYFTKYNMLKNFSYTHINNIRNYVLRLEQPMILAVDTHLRHCTV